MPDGAHRPREEQGRNQDQEEILRRMTDGTLRFLHVCEVCGKREMLTPQEAYDAGWDYPPTMGQFGAVSPRTCGSCTVSDTLWWALTADKTPVSRLSPAQQDTLARILGEPWSLLEGGEPTDG